MRLINSDFYILSDTLDILKNIEFVGRVCYKSEDKITNNSAEIFVKNIINRGHESVLEHEKATVKLICDRGVSHELVRHRLASYSQESTRYVNYAKKDNHITFIRPSWFQHIKTGEYIMELNDIYKVYDNDCFRVIQNEKHFNEYEILKNMLQCEKSYLDLIEKGCNPEQARAVLPNSLKTEIIMTANLREWRHIFNLRCHKTAHPDIRVLMKKLLIQFKESTPIVFDDLYDKFIE